MGSTTSKTPTTKEEPEMSATEESLRTLDDVELPPPGTWEIDPVHSQVSFVVRHMVVAKVRGKFNKFSGTIQVAENHQDSKVEATIDAASIDTGEPNRDTHIRSADFLDVEHYPEITYRSTRVRPADGDKWDVTGQLTIRDVTRDVTLSVEFCGVNPDPWGKIRAGFLATTEINREDFDITWNQALETGGFVVGKGVKVEIDAEAVRMDDGEG
jgi:polyisoprenoid-binding protein YceI